MECGCKYINIYFLPVQYYFSISKSNFFAPELFNNSNHFYFLANIQKLQSSISYFLSF